jgi:hypothetical protein
MDLWNEFFDCWSQEDWDRVLKKYYKEEDGIKSYINKVTIESEANKPTQWVRTYSSVNSINFREEIYFHTYYAKIQYYSTDGKNFKIFERSLRKLYDYNTSEEKTYFLKVLNFIPKKFKRRHAKKVNDLIKNILFFDIDSIFVSKKSLRNNSGY